MRVEATVPDSRGNVLAELAQELGASRSQIVDEALTLFFRAVMEVRRGRRLVSMGGAEPACELVTPTLTQLEWTNQRQSLTLAGSEMERVAELLESPPAPTDALKGIMRSR